MSVVVIPADAWLNGTPTSASDQSVLDNLESCPGSSLFWEGFLPLDLGGIEQHVDLSKGVPAVRLSLKGVVQSLPVLGRHPGGRRRSNLRHLGGPGRRLAGGPGIRRHLRSAYRLHMQVDVTNPNDPTISVNPP